MKIKFGTTSNNVVRAELLGSILGLFFASFYFLIRSHLDDAHKSRFNSSISNLTASQIRLFCGIPYDDCLCSMQSAKNEHLKHCLTDRFLLLSRIVPLLSFVLQIWLVRDLFTFSGHYVRFVVYGLWITAVFIFVIIANGIYQGSCSHRIISGVLFGTGGLLFVLVYWDMVNKRDTPRSSHNFHHAFHAHVDDTFNEQTTEEIDNEPIVWRDLL